MLKVYAAFVKLGPSLADLIAPSATSHAKLAVVIISVIHAKLDWSRMLQACAAPVKLGPLLADLIVSSATSHAKRAAMTKNASLATMDLRKMMMGSAYR